MKNKKLLIIVAAVVLLAAGAAAFFLLRGDDEPKSGDKEISPPTEYRLGGVDVISLPVMGDGVTVYQVRKETVEPSGGESSAVAETGEAVTYRYEGLTAPGALAGAYTGLLTGADSGFVYVDESLLRSKAPDFEAEAGEVRIARQGPEEGKVMLLHLTWTAESCTVTADAPEGEIADPPKPEPMSTIELLDYIRYLPPEALGLEGDSMADYHIYSQGNMILVDGRACLMVKVYHDGGEAGTNEVLGQYLIPGDRSRIYRIDGETGTVAEVE